MRHTSAFTSARLRPLLPLLLLLLFSIATSGVHAQWFTDPCQYHPHALLQLRIRFESIVGQKYATDAVYAHLQTHLEQYESTRLRNDVEAVTTPHKPLVLSFHGPTGTGKSLTANSIASALFVNPRSSHIHTYHGSDFSGTDPEHVQESINFLKQEFASHVRRCPLALFIIEEIHMMAPGVLDGLRHLMDAQAPNSRFKIRNTDAPTTGASSNTGADSINDVDDTESASSSAASSSGSSSVVINFSHVIWLLTTNIGSQQVQKIAYDAAKQGLPRESISPVQLHDMLHASLAHSDQLQLLRDSSVLSALVPFFPLFKAHVKECATVQLQFRRKYWLLNAQVSSFEWDTSVLSYASSQLKYNGPISIYGCKNVHEVLTSVMLAPLTRHFRREQEERDHALHELMRDARVSRPQKAWQYAGNLLAHARQIFTGPVWNFGRANITMVVEPSTNDAGAEEVVFRIEQVAEGDDDSVTRSEIRQPLNGGSAQFHTVTESRTPTKHVHLMEDVGATQKDEL